MVARLFLGVLSAALLGVAACGAREAAPQAAATVEMKGYAFAPAAVTITAGQAVRWTNADVPKHTATSDARDWASPELAPGESFTRTFATPGTYPYHCAVHSGTMQGTIVVQ